MLCLALYLKGDELNPENVNTFLGVTASRSHTKGQKSLTKTNKEVIAQTGLWEFITHDKVSSHSFCDHLDYLKSALGNRSTDLTNIKNVQEAFIDVFISISKQEGEAPTFEFEITPQNVADLKEFGLPVQFTIYT